ncbi:unnamed protein product [Acanthoscelides obtectus]|uniref:Uncharacterized protein n=1 Tax=Acanthoscelides obtectus TaxID=200917 RepID=A0A9P0LS92_ACAOB|nr:unnamed protein product [Acanthoscelides obtectus]CAK1652769.1 hypothetical protein AOBTE_LOCUS17906 [Acanthoscelides obtectus]
MFTFTTIILQRKRAVSISQPTILCDPQHSSWPENTRKTRTIRAPGSFGYLYRIGISIRRTSTTCRIAGKIRLPGQ